MTPSLELVLVYIFVFLCFFRDYIIYFVPLCIYLYTMAHFSLIAYTLVISSSIFCAYLAVGLPTEVYGRCPHDPILGYDMR